MLRISLFIIFILIFGISKNSAQELNACDIKLLDGFIQDGQNYTLTLEDSKKGLVYFTFFEGFHYRILICSNTSKVFKITLYDIEKKMLFSDLCNNYSKYIDLKFKSNIACVAEIAVDNISGIKPIFNISMGFNEDKVAK
jgi:hypothetical protein